MRRRPYWLSIFFVLIGVLLFPTSSFSQPRVANPPGVSSSIRPELSVDGLPLPGAASLISQTAMAEPAAATVWQEKTFSYSSGDFGEYPSLSLGAGNSTPRLAFWDAANQSIVVWMTGDVYKVLDTGPDVLPYPALAVDAYARPHVVWMNSFGSVYYAVYDYETGGFIKSYVGAHAHPEVPPSIAVGPDGSVHIVYYGEMNTTVGTKRVLRYALYVGGLGTYDKFYVEDLEVSYTHAVGWGASVATDDAGYPHVVYYDYGSYYLMYKKKTGSGWQSAEQVEWFGAQPVDHRTSIAVDHDGLPHISYWLPDSGKLRYCTWDTATMQYACEWADSDTRAGRYSDITVDANNVPHISYHLAKVTNGQPDGDLRYATKEGGGWVQQTLDSAGDTGIDTSIAIDYQGYVHIAFYDGSNRLRYIYEQPDAGGKLGFVGCPWGSRNCNPCASSVVDTFKNLRTHGEILSFYVDPAANPTRDPDNFLNQFADAFHHHWQGVARPMAQGEPYLVTTLDKSQYHLDSGVLTPAASVFSVAHLGSRDSKGLRFRPNRVWESFGPWYWSSVEAVPPDTDSVVHSEIMSYSSKHPGGIQMVGDILVVPFDDDEHEVWFYDLADPANPKFITKADLLTGVGASSAAITLLDNGSYLMAIYTKEAALDFWVSHNTPFAINASTTWSMLRRFNVPDDIVESIIGWDVYQALNFVTDCATGKLYLIATGNEGQGASICPRDFGIDAPCYPDGLDMAVLYEVEIDMATANLTQVAVRPFDCTEEGTSTEHCNFDAAAGVYVDPNNQMILYATEHASDGYNESVKLMEFRSVPHGSCLTLQDAWLELYKDVAPSYDHSLMIDYPDYVADSESYKYLNVFGYEDNVHAVQWCAPQGYSYYLYEDKNPCSGRMEKLTGTSRFSQARLEIVGGELSCLRLAADAAMTRVVDPTHGVRWEYVLDEVSIIESGVSAAATAQSDRSIEVSLPPGAVSDAIEVTFQNVAPPMHEMLDMVALSYGFVLGHNENSLPDDFIFDLPVEITITYAEEDIAGMDEMSLFPWFWDASLEGWIPAHETCPGGAWPAMDYDANTYTFGICRFGEVGFWGVTEPLRVLVDEIHDTRMSLDYSRAQQIAVEEGPGTQPEWYYLGELDNSGGNDYDLEAVTTGSLTDGLLADYDVLFIPYYLDALSTAEVAAVQRFVARGGGLVQTGDCGFNNPNPELSEAYGVSFYPPCLFRPLDAPYTGELDLDTTAQHGALQGVTAAVHNWSQALDVFDTAEPILRAPDDTWMDVDGSGDFNGDVDPVGAFFAGAANDTGCGRMVALGDSHFSDADLGWTGNEVLMKSIFEWAAAGDACEAAADQLPARVLVDEGHEGRLTLDWSRAEALASDLGPGFSPDEFYLGELVTALAGAYTFESTSAPLSLDLLEDYDALVLPPYYAALGDAEIQAIHDYVAQGGGLFIVGDVYYEMLDPELTSAYGFTFNYGGVFEGSGQSGAFELSLLDRHPAVAGDHAHTVDWSQALTLQEGAVNLLDTQLLDAWEDRNHNNVRDSGEEGRFSLAAVYDQGCGRVIGWGDSAFTDYTLAWTQNERVARSLLDWLTDAQACHRVVLVDESHDNRLTVRWDRAEEIVDNQGWGYPTFYILNTLGERLDDAYMFVPNRDQMLTPASLRNFDALVIPWHFDAFTEDEVQAVQGYIREGGGVLFLADAAWENPNVDLMAEYGFHIHNAALLVSGQATPDEYLIDAFASHPSVQDLAESGFSYKMGGGCSVELGSRATSVLTTAGADAWRDLDWDGVYTPGVDETGDFTVAAVHEGVCGRAAVVADDFFGEDPLYGSENDKLIRALLNWVAAGSACEPVYMPLIMR